MTEEKKPNPFELTEEEKKLPKEAQDKLKDIKKKLSKFKTQVTEKFDEYIMGLALLPPEKPKDNKPVDQNKISVLVLIDDTDSTKMPKHELRNKLATIIDKMGAEIDKNLFPETIILSEVWQSCYDAKYELLNLISQSAPLYDPKGMIGAIKISEIHKQMVLKKFEKYIVSYVLAGSLIRGDMHQESDIDVWIVIDDTDVKKMTRVELKDKLRAIIMGMGVEAGNLTGIKNKLNIQVYILTDFWECLKDANPVIFTLLRDGVPFYDRGIFMPWKQLLKMGKIKPSQESIDMFMNTGEQMVERVRFKIKQLIEADIYWAVLTPAQAALMMWGLPPPTPQETLEQMKEVFVKKEKLLEPEYIETLVEIRRFYKEIEHGGLKTKVTGKDVDNLLDKAEKYLKRIKKLFGQIEKIKEAESMTHVYDTTITIIRDILRLEGIERVKDVEAVKIFETEMIHTGKIPQKYLTMLNNIVTAKKHYDAGKLTKNEVSKSKKETKELTKFMIEFIQRKRGKELERARIRVKHGDKYGEIIMLEDTAFIIHDIDHEEREITKAPITKDGSLGPITKSGLEELEKALAKIEIPTKVFIKQPIFEKMKDIFGKDVEILLQY
jgi:predicted nucleotidyltransferase/uncharacterized protein (UPF0332 family)